MSMASESSEARFYKLSDPGSFRIDANFLGSVVHINETDRRKGFKPFIQSLRDKKKLINSLWLENQLSSFLKDG